jgi:ankyrin repeat domain-containing protein 50
VFLFFCDEKIEAQRDGKAILRSLIFQILARRRKLIRHVKSAYDIQGSHLVENFNELWRIFTAIARDKRVGTIHVIIDAIDECEERSGNRFLEGISTLVGNA